MAQLKKPQKKPDNILLPMIKEKINKKQYVFVTHALQRKVERNISDLLVINILENNGNVRRSRNKSKDVFHPGYYDWNYCIEGYNEDDEKIRIIISFDPSNLLVITVINI